MAQEPSYPTLSREVSFYWGVFAMTKEPGWAAYLPLKHGLWIHCLSFRGSPSGLGSHPGGRHTVPRLWEGRAWTCVTWNSFAEVCLLSAD
jgi:hypothetical protein